MISFEKIFKIAAEKFAMQCKYVLKNLSNFRLDILIKYILRRKSVYILSILCLLIILCQNLKYVLLVAEKL